MSENRSLTLGPWNVSDLHVEPHIIRGCVRIDEENPFFSGHFPEAPLLPGMAQVSLVQRVVEHGLQQRLTLSHITKLKFSDRILPSTNTVAFRIRISEKPSASGANVRSHSRVVRRIRFQMFSKKTEFSSGDLTMFT